MDVALVSVIRRFRLREGMPIREISRRTRLSRNTVRKYLASQELEPAYSPRKSPSKLDDYEDLVELGYTGFYDRVGKIRRAKTLPTVTELSAYAKTLVQSWVSVFPGHHENIPQLAPRILEISASRASRRNWTG
jgi:transposase